jgi:hypothetical protein
VLSKNGLTSLVSVLVVVGLLQDLSRMKQAAASSLTGRDVTSTRVIALLFESLFTFN